MECWNNGVGVNIPAVALSMPGRPFLHCAITPLGRVAKCASTSKLQRPVCRPGGEVPLAGPIGPDRPAGCRAEHAGHVCSCPAQA